ncbi:46 kDa FK506-binding nuclear protein-like isoform X2 [Artemia franciscana]|uniref:46 kDa FK506-binding nuclear protein-like isoform X2 n=1 Tax=Artemia franciscana TaxID=6661 RepID=UPI0032DA4D25
MFWGLVIEPKKKYSQTVQSSFHVSGAVVDPAFKGDEVLTLFVEVEDQNYAIANLKKGENVHLDLNFEQGTKINFHSKGNGTIHLTGYLIPDEVDEADSFLDSEAEEEEEESAEEEEKVSPQKDADKKKKKKKAEVEMESDEDEEDQEGEEEAGDEEEEDEEVEDEEAEDEEPEPKKKKIEPEPKKVKKEPKVEEAQPKLSENGKKLTKAEKKRLKAEKLQGAQPESPKTQQLKMGVKVTDLKVGQGQTAQPGKRIAVYYVGRLQHNNKQFDASQKGPGFKFKLGTGEVIKGWDVGIVGMKVGGKRRIVCPHQAAYGTRGAPPAIPPNSTLVFDVELKEVL